MGTGAPDRIATKHSDPGVLQGLEAHKYRNTLDCALQILKNEGPKA